MHILGVICAVAAIINIIMGIYFSICENYTAGYLAIFNFLVLGSFLMLKVFG